MSVFDKFPAHHWNQASIVSSNMPLFLRYNCQVEQTLILLRSHLKSDQQNSEQLPKQPAAGTKSSSSVREALRKAITFSRTLEQFKFKEQGKTMESCLANAEKLAYYNEIGLDGQIANERYTN